MLLASRSGNSLYSGQERGLLNSSYCVELRGFLPLCSTGRTVQLLRASNFFKVCDIQYGFKCRVRSDLTVKLCD
jgi:hypothetical protein